MRDPLVWVSAACVVLGAAVALFTKRGKTPQRREINKRKRALWIPILLNVAAILFLAGLFFTQAKGLTVSLSLTGMAVCGLSALAFRFPKSVGLPILGVVALVATATVLSLAEFRPLAKNIELAEVRLVSETKVERKIETRALLPLQATHFQVETFGIKQWPFSQVSVLRMPPGTVLSDLTLWSTSEAQRRVVSPDIVWFLFVKLGWAQNLTLAPPSNPQLNYLYTLQTVDGKFNWALKAPQTRLE